MMDCSLRPSRGLSRRLLGQIRYYWVQLSAVFLLDSLATRLSLLKPLPLKIDVHGVVRSTPLPRFLHRWLPDALSRSAPMVLALVAGSQAPATLSASGRRSPPTEDSSGF